MAISSSFTLEKNALFLEHQVIQFTLSTCIGIQAVLHLQCSNTGLSACVHDRSKSPILKVVNFQRCAYASGSNKEPEPIPSMSGMSEIACPPSPITEDPSALPSSTLPPTSSQ